MHVCVCIDVCVYTCMLAHLALMHIGALGTERELGSG